MIDPLLSEIVVRVSRAFERAGVEYALGGSIASSLHGEPRSTVDVDFAVRLSEAAIPSFIEALGEDFDVDEEALREAVRHGHSANIFFLPLVLKIDLFIRGRDPFDTSELPAARDDRSLHRRPGRRRVRGGQPPPKARLVPIWR